MVFPRQLKTCHGVGESQTATLCNTRIGIETTPHNHRIHNNVPTRTRHAQAPGPARLEKNTTTKPPDPPAAAPAAAHGATGL
jgi:hypothetical protein